MWARLRLSSLFGLTCGLLWLCPAAGITCPAYEILLSQLKNMAKRDFLNSFMTDQGLNLPHLNDTCKRSSDFLVTETLKDLPPVTFLQTVSQNLRHVVQILKEPVFEAMNIYLQGIDNNVCCMLQKLPPAPTACPAPGSKRTLSPTPTVGSFSWKLERCKVIQSYQRFMEAVGKVLETWGPSPGQRNRNRRSLLNVLLGQRRKVRAG
ncbi:oncostatin-M [Phascolarctos cinereus]|uniref:Oncostatin-M isoform X2 n=1 Tax=Phascolarctos cinereus TaxID=38626 RepID=A0A6P5L261_PHACI|nr:oncostatin-M isoform X2 [Phascolarctos cinereus]XP_020852379.1 oncostatin-M isoform X2 [Phascolarctos cinereus]XP_020852380.1 oncostatin-M isoform X2 [Phascolarctos cinereus]